MHRAKKTDYYQRLAKAFLKEVGPFGFENAILVEISGHAIRHAHVLRMPRKALKHYVGKRCDGADPILKHALVSTVPFFWDDLQTMGHFTSPELEFMEVMRDLKVASGLTVPLAPLSGRKTFMSLSSHAVAEPNHGDVARLLGLCSRYQIDWHAGLKLETPELVRWPRSRLTTRQVECLRLCMVGMSSSEIGREIGVCENTVQFHISNAMQQLGVSNRTTAVVRAIELGYLSNEPADSLNH